MPINFKIVTPAGLSIEDTVDQVTVDTADGQITVLPEHTPILSVLASGEAMVKKGEGETSYAIFGGFLEVKKGSEVTILADGAESGLEIDEEKVKEAIARGEELKKQKASMDSEEYARVAAALERDMARLRVLRRRK